MFYTWLYDTNGTMKVHYLTSVLLDTLKYDLVTLKMIWRIILGTCTENASNLLCFINRKCNFFLQGMIQSLRLRNTLRLKRIHMIVFLCEKNSTVRWHWKKQCLGIRSYELCTHNLNMFKKCVSNASRGNKDATAYTKVSS